MDKKKVKSEKKHKRIGGVVVSDKMDKTIVVSVTSFKTHPKYLKKYKSTKKYKVHDEKNEFKVGDVVEFIESKPVSRDKKFIVVKA